MPKKLFASLVVIGALAFSVGSQAAADPKEPTITCVVNGETVVDYAAHSTFLTLTWFAADPTAPPAGTAAVSLKGGGKLPLPTPEGAVSYDAVIDTPTGPVHLADVCT
jgi:hypothetical protein